MPTDVTTPLTTPPFEPPSGPAQAAPSPGRPGASRHAWRVFGAVLVLAAVAWGTFNVISLLAHEERTEVTTYDDTIRVIDVATGSGSVTVTGSPEAQVVTVTARISEGLRSTGDRQTVVGDRLELRATCPAIGGEWCRVSYTVVVPTDVDVVVAADDGRISISDIDGSVDANGDNGALDVNDVGGDLTLQNDNGRIEARGLRSSMATADGDNGRVVLEFLEPPTSVVATTDNGSVEVVVPDTDDAYRLDIDTDNGSVDDDDFRIDPDSERSIRIRSDNGSVTARRATD